MKKNQRLNEEVKIMVSDTVKHADWGITVDTESKAVHRLA